jgi:hypothetical protein
MCVFVVEDMAQAFRIPTTISSVSRDVHWTPVLRLAYLGGVTLPYDSDPVVLFGDIWGSIPAHHPAHVTTWPFSGVFVPHFETSGSV